MNVVFSWGVLLALVLSQAIPYVALALSRQRPSWWTGLVTLILSFGTSFSTELIADNYHVRVALLTGFATFAAARLHYVAIPKGEKPEQKILGTHTPAA